MSYVYTLICANQPAIIKNFSSNNLTDTQILTLSDPTTNIVVRIFENDGGETPIFEDNLNLTVSSVALDIVNHDAFLVNPYIQFNKLYHLCNDASKTLSVILCGVTHF